MRVLGFFLFFIGFICSLTIIGAIIGIPLMLMGAAMFFMGGRKTVITNTITVHSPEPSPMKPVVTPRPHGEALDISPASAPLEDHSSNLEE